jgi:O-methyltransferase
MYFFRFLFDLVSNVLAKNNLYLIKSLSFNKNHFNTKINLDYVRYQSLELCYEEITRKNIAGCVAELGVYKGNFASKLNILFKDRPLYLFDTFEGFNNKDINIEITKNFSSGKQDFSDTSVQGVMKKMKYPENCIIKKGYFPETVKDINVTFCFVNIDTDLYLPISEGLKFFYPRLEKGGYIFVHDFNNSNYPGARKAVYEFCEENNIGYMPIPDNCGTVALTK